MAAVVTPASLSHEFLPDFENTHKLLFTANSLRGYLQRELSDLRLGNRFCPELKQVYEAAYLPMARSLARGLNASHVPGAEILHEALAPQAESAATQLGRLLKFLYSAIIAASDRSALPI